MFVEVPRSLNLGANGFLPELVGNFLKVSVLGRLAHLKANKVTSILTLGTMAAWMHPLIWGICDLDSRKAFFTDSPSETSQAGARTITPFSSRCLTSSLPFSLWPPDLERRSKWRAPWSANQHAIFLPRLPNAPETTNVALGSNEKLGLVLKAI